MKKNRMLKGLVLASVLSLAMAGCGNKEAESVENTNAPVVEETVQETVADTGTEESTSAQEETVPEVTAEPVELAAGFDEEFVLAMDEELYIGREDISISLNWINCDEYGTWFGYILRIEGKEINGSGLVGTQVENQVNQEEFTENRVVCVGAEEDKNVTLKITAGTEIAEPLVLSGNAADEYVTTKQEYVVGERIILFLDEGIKVYGDTVELLEKLIAIAEKESGLYLENDTPFSNVKGNDTDWIFGQEAFTGVDPSGEKFHVYVVEYDVCIPCAVGYGVVLNPIDLEIADGEGYTMIHETLHCLQMKNGVQMSSVMDEGFATYMGGRICDKDEEMNFNFDATMNYSYYETKITKENAEEVFCAEKEDNWENYLYGYRFMTYLYENYGDEIFIKILDSASPDASVSVASITAAEAVPYIKANTSDTVFEDFAVWLEQNAAKFTP